MSEKCEDLCDCKTCRYRKKYYEDHKEKISKQSLEAQRKKKVCMKQRIIELVKDLEEKQVREMLLIFANDYSYKMAKLFVEKGIDVPLSKC